MIHLCRSLIIFILLCLIGCAAQQQQRQLQPLGLRSVSDQEFRLMYYPNPFYWNSKSAYYNWELRQRIRQQEAPPQQRNFDKGTQIKLINHDHTITN